MLRLWDTVVVQAWRIHDRIADTSSGMDWIFGMSPRICTTFWFQNRDEFYYVQETLEELRICHLNEKHLKEMKRRV